MNIRDNSNDRARICHLKCGAVFKHEGALYMITNADQNAVRLEDGHLFQFDSNLTVTKVSGEFVLN